MWKIPGLLGLGASGWLVLSPVAHAQQNTIVWARNGDIDSLNPQRATSTLSRQVWMQIYDTLLAFNQHGKLVPNMATSWKVTDGGKTVTFDLHKNIKCADGKPFTANDVVFTVDSALSDKNPSLTKTSWGPITSVKALNDYQVRFKFSKPFAAFLSFQADPFASMICDDMKGKAGFGTTAANGSGPWKFVSWNKGSKIILKRNPYYHNYGWPVKNAGPPKVKKLVIEDIPEGQTRFAGLETGEFNVIQPSIENVKSIQSNPKTKLYIAQRTGQNMFLEFAVHRAPFDDVRARKAIAEAINVPLALKLVFGKLVQREYCPLSPGVMGNDPAFCKKYGYHYDPAGAKKLLVQLGYGPDHHMKIIMMTWKGDSRGKLLQIFQNMLSQVNIDAKIQVMDIGTLNARVRQENEIKTGTDTLDLMGWTWFDPDLLYLLWHSPGAYAGYTTPELDKLLEATRTTIDTSKRTLAVKAVEKYLLQNAVEIPIYTPGWNWLYAAQTRLKGFTIGAFNRPLFNDAHF